MPVEDSYLGTLERDESGEYIESRGEGNIPLSLGDAVDALGQKLRFCGCGIPSEALRYVGGILEAFAREDRYALPWEEWCAIKDAAFGTKNLAAQYFIVYQLDDIGLMEHGTGAMSGWLTDLGRGVLADIKRLGAEESNQQ
jgi:hypothetical protein